MFSSKQSVDRHVSNILGRIRDEKERNNRGYQIARLYLEVKEYELAKRYVAAFLSVKEGFAPAHKLLGQILEGLNQIEKAVTAYKRSLEIDEKQKDVVLKICELYLQTDIDPERAKYWAERAEKVWPHHDTVFKLREKIYTEREGDKNTDDLENLIASELVKRPKDPKLRAKLMRLYIDTGRINEAYEHAVGVEKKAAYPSSLEWYQCLQDIFQVYQEETGGEINGAFHQNLLLAQCFLTSLTMEQSKVADVADALHKFDQTIESARKVTGGDDWNIVYREMQAQLYFLAGTLLLKRAQQDHLGWMEATQMAAACYISSYAYEPPHTKTPWYAKAKEEDKKVFDRLRLLANFRASQTGHMMKQMCKGDSQKWISSLKESHFGEKGRGRLYETLFTLRHLKGSKSSSYLYQGSALSSLLCVYPTDAQLKEYDKECHLLYANSLHHLIWIALQYYSVRDRTQPNYNFSVFDDLQYSVTNLQLASPESLCQIDTQIFLWATTRTTALHQQEHQRAAPVNGERPSVLPVLINERLCTVEQDQWWNTAYQLFKNTAKENLGKLRLVLQRGIETVRLCKNHGMDVSLVVHIGRTFEERVEELKAKSLSAYDYSNEIDHLHNRAVQYWREACDILEKFQRNQNLPSPKQKLFASYETPMSDRQIRDLLEEGKFFLACDAMKQGEDELAVEEFDKLNMADASYYQAQILRKMADEAVNNVTRGQEEQADEQEEALLIRARDALYLTMDRTRDNRHHKLAPHLATELDEIESRLNRLNSNKTVNDSQRSDVRGETSAVVDINVSSKSLATPSAQSTPHPKARPKVNISIGDSPQKQFHTQPSPERLHAQIRSLSFSQDTLIKQLMERNEELVKQNAAILAELSASRKLIEKLMTARPIDPTGAYPVVMPAAAASPLHHPSLAPHAAAAQSPLGPHAASTPPRHVQPVPPGAASPFYGSPYRPHPEYEYAAAYSPHAGYPIYPQGAAPAPPLQHYPGYQDPTSQPHVAGPVPKTVPVGTLAGSAGKEPSAAGPVKSSGAHVEEEDYEDYYYEDGSDEGGDDDEGDMYQVPESQPVQDWPYGNNVSISGKSTINYSPQRNQQQFPGQPTTYYGQGPASTGLPMPGPGFFSSPERPTGAYNAGRFIPPGGIDSVSTQLHPPRPGFIGTIGSPVSNAQTPPRAAVADKTGGVVSGRSPTQTGANTTEAALTGGSLIKMPQPPQVSAATKFAIPISSGIFSGSTDMNAAIAVGSPITTVTGVGMTSKDVQPKSPGVNDEDDDEGAAGDDSYQGPDFEPIIPLPEEVEVKTGEEEEKVLFVARSRLYIFIENQWKERGTGDIKILWKEETGQARVVMRRDQVLKVCANHYILPNMKIDVKSDKEAKILTWIAIDFSEGEGAMQKFSCRFKTEGIAAEFRAKFEEAVELCVKRQKQAVKKDDKDAVKKKDDGVDLLAKLKPKPGSWNCEACYVNNPPEVIACVACTTPKPGAELKTPQQRSIFGAGNVTTGGFNAVTTKANTSGFTFGSSSTKPTNTSFTFGQTPSTTQDTKSKATFTFGTPSSSTTQTGFKFGSTTSDNPATSSGFKFGTSTVVTATTNVTETKSTPTISPPKFTFNKPVPSTTTTPAADALKLMASKADSTQSSDKPTFGGFTFTSKPVVSEKKEEVAKKEEKEIEAKEEEAPKANPFASFSFSSTKTVNKPVESKTSEGMAFGTAAASNLDFAILATEDATAFTKKSDFKGFEGAGAKLFEGNKDEAADESGHADDYEPDVDFKPIIPLPDLVEVKTGEEEEEKLFGHRAKLYRHDNETKQWKERGLGEIKILKHKETGRCRVLMRREQVLKLCANHYIATEMSLNPLKTSDRAWCWYASDYSEDEMKYEQLAVKFKSGDVAEKFKDIFEKCQKDIREQPTDAENVDENKKDKGAKPQTKSQPSLGEMFKPKTGQWDCQVCYVRNDANLIICVACQTPKPGHEGEAAKQKASEPKKDPFSGGFKIADGAVRDSGQSSGQVFTFGVSAANKKPADETPPKTGFLFGMPTSPKAASFSFTTASTPVSATTAESSGTPFNLSSSGFKFGTSPSTDTTKTPSKETGATKTFGLSTSGFSFTPTTTPAKQDKLKSPQSPEGDYYVNTDEEDSHIYFEPIVQLPEKVDLVTGEEDEEPLYCHRAKLFRYDDNQWKERGLGDIKILRHKQTKKCRLVMRREQILKICLNHMISDVLNLQPMQNNQGKAWVWVATDFAEGEPSDEKLAIKFKTAEIANEFKNAFDDAKQGKGKVLDLPPTPIKVRERTDSSSRDSTRERKDSARERKDSAKERERRHSAGKSESPDKVKATTNLESFSFKPQSTSASGTNTSTPKVSFTFGSSDSRVSSVFGGSSSTTAVPGKFTFGSGASISSGFNFGTTPTKLESAASPSGAAGESGKTFGTGTSLLAQMLMSDDPIDVPDLEITYEKKPSKEQAEKAAEFKLPSTFYNYEDAKPCPGCRGCEDDDDYHKDVIFVKEEMPSSEQMALAQKYMLPKSFFLYENKAPCRGCLGCYDDIEGTIYKNKPLATETKGESQKEIKGVEAEPTKNYIGGNAPVFGRNTSGEFSFAAIAAKSPPSAFTFGSKTTSDKPFSFAGSGTQLFRNLKSGEDDDGNDDETVQNEDIHFEPIVHLEEVEVKTGEEEETAIYSQRSKLFRFTDGQWKERGIGDMKILKHNSTGRFRLLMRRDQILKICCNHQITADLELRPMNTSEVAWCWFATDFTDGQPVDEQFALKFKNQDLARQFKEKVTECQHLLNQGGNSNVPVADTDSSNNEKADDKNVEEADTSAASAQDSDHSYSISEADKSGNEKSEGEGEAEYSGYSQSGAEGGNDDDEYVTDDEEEMQLLFSKRATMLYEDADHSWKQIGMGDLQVVYDDDVNGNRIRMTKDNGALICNHIICKDYQLQCNEKKKFVEWTAKDFSTDEPIKRTFRIQFSSKNAVAEFKAVFAEGLELAKEWDIREVTDFVPTPIFSEK